MVKKTHRSEKLILPTENDYRQYKEVNILKSFLKTMAILVVALLIFVFLIFMFVRQIQL